METRGVVLFTSQGPGEGKTACAVYYGRSLARRGLKSVIVDLDLGNPEADRLLRTELSGKPGLADLIAGEKKVDEVVYATKQANLFYLPSGSSRSAEGRTAVDIGFKPLLELLLGRFDRVIVSASPLLSGNQALVMAGHVESVCLVLKTRKTRRWLAARAIHQLRKAGAPLRWVVLRRLTAVTLVDRD
jgi:Mrp family chromosome partitioning ATPase